VSVSVSVSVSMSVSVVCCPWLMDGWMLMMMMMAGHRFMAASKVLGEESVREQGGGDDR